MKDRLITLMLAAAAFALFYLFFVPKPAPPGAGVELPVSTEIGQDGYQALWRWLRTQNVRVFALRDPYSNLLQHAGPMPPAGNLLITTMPYRVPVRSGELTDLKAWIGRGNTLVVMAALDDTPRWALAGDPAFIRALDRMTQMHFAVPDTGSSGSGAAAMEKSLRQALEEQRTVIEPKTAHRLFDGVHSVVAVSEFPASHWEPRVLDDSAVIELGQAPVRGRNGAARQAAIWLKSEGNGQILVFGFATVFSNRALAERDNARLLSNIIAWSRAAQGFVIFDDHHQGAVSYYDAKAFFHDPRLHRTLLWLVLIWLVFVLGAHSMRAAPSRWNPADITQFIGMTAGFFSSALTRPTAAQELFNNFFREIPSATGSIGDPESAWAWLSQHGVGPAPIAELRRLHDKTTARQPVDLIRLQNILSKLKGTYK